ncbi:hypothetical protein QFZ77_004528 [Paenibacillus sp. V4I3]|nr:MULTISPECIES: hypothetical protein [unclassified Paenibacillus]MDQ0875869.1 hypothetical protein [Paenibacillus sp. V4I3]MDQ0888067.1 hypothetical protein [Paenibacillus sp. V4I9]
MRTKHIQSNKDRARPGASGATSVDGNLEEIEGPVANDGDP